MLATGLTHASRTGNEKIDFQWRTGEEWYKDVTSIGSGVKCRQEINSFEVNSE